MTLAEDLFETHLTVSDLERSLAYYRRAIGLELLGQDAAEASLGSGGAELLHLVESPGAAPARGRDRLPAGGRRQSRRSRQGGQRASRFRSDR